MARIFLSYAREDETQVRGIYRRLIDAGFEVWMDKIDLLPGQRWQQEIRPRSRRRPLYTLVTSAIGEQSTGHLFKINASFSLISYSMRYKSLILLHNRFSTQKYKNLQSIDKLMLIGFYPLRTRAVIAWGDRKWPTP